MRVSKAWAAFALGCLLGTLGGVYGTRRALRRLIPHTPNIERFSAKLTKELGLDAAQQQSIKKILEDYRDRVSSVNKDFSAKTGELRLSLRNEIRKVLNPEQLKIFEERVTKADARRKAAAAFQ